MDAVALYHDNLDLIVRIIEITANRQTLMSREDREDFGSYVHVKLLDGHCRILGEYCGRGPFRIFLTTVIQRLMQDYRNHIWGKWRVSEAARNAGASAILLETLTRRDGYSQEQALQIMVSNHGLSISHSELETLASTLPKRRTGRADIEVEDLPAPSPDRDHEPKEEEWRQLVAKTETALAQALNDLDLIDRMILKMICRDNLPISRVAQTLKLAQRPLYRRIPKILARVRTCLERSGIDATTAAKVIGKKYGSIKALPEETLDPQTRERGPT